MVTNRDVYAESSLPDKTSLYRKLTRMVARLRKEEMWSFMLIQH